MILIYIAVGWIIFSVLLVTVIIPVFDALAKKLNERDRRRFERIATSTKNRAEAGVATDRAEIAEERDHAERQRLEKRAAEIGGCSEAILPREALASAAQLPHLVGTPQSQAASLSKWAQIIAEEEAKPADLRNEQVLWEATHFEECRLRRLGEKRKYFEEKLALIKEKRRAAELLEIARQAAEEAAAGEESRQLQVLCHEALEIANLHLRALLIERRRKLFDDAYGRTIVDNWVKEIHYFVSTSVVPGLSPDSLATWQQAFSGLVDCRCGPPSAAEANNRELRLDGERREYLVSTFCRLVAEYVESKAQEEPLAGGEINDSKEFELFCEAILRREGWDARQIGGTGDQGADVIASRGGIVAVFQCKLYTGAVGNAAVQEIHAAKAFYRADIAAVVSRSGYTKSARQAAEAIGVSLLHAEELPTFNVR